MHRASVVAVLLACVACGSRTGEDLGLGGEAEAGATGGSVHDAAGVAPEAGPPPSFKVGQYKCQSSLTSTSGNAVGVGGGTGMLAVTQSGAAVSAVYTGDLFVTGSMEFQATAVDTAVPSPLPQMLDVLCVATGGSSRGTLYVSSGAITVDAKTLFLSFQGTIDPAQSTGAPCQDAPTTGSLTCTMQ